MLFATKGCTGKKKCHKPHKTPTPAIDSTSAFGAIRTTTVAAVQAGVIFLSSGRRRIDPFKPLFFNSGRDTASVYLCPNYRHHQF